MKWEKKFPAIKVYSMSIAALVDDMVNEVGKTVAWGLSKSDVNWLLTVPAIWSDAAKAPISLGCDEFAMGLRIDSQNRRELSRNVRMV